MTDQKMKPIRSFIASTLVAVAAKDPELKTFNENFKVASFSVPINKGYKSKSGEWVDQTYWVTVKGSNFVADAIMDNVTKGSVVTCSGELTLEQYENSFGKQVQNLIFDANRIVVSAKVPMVSEDMPRTPTRTTSSTKKDSSEFLEDVPF